MYSFTWIFLIALAAGLLLQLWLLQRHRSHVSAHRGSLPDAFAEDFTLDQHQKAADYTLARSALGRLNLIYGTLLLLVWTLGGGLDLLDRLLQPLSPGYLAGGIIFIFLAMLLMGLLELPFSIWSTFVLEERFGFNRTTPRRFILDIVLQMLLALILGAPLIALFLWLMERAGNLWWLAAWLAWVGFMLLVSWLFPTLIAPLFNKFTPLEEGELKERISSLLERCGFASKGIFVMDGSRRSGHGNAYFTGLGKSKRIVFFDTLMKSLGSDELEAILAHELGHFKHHHIRKRLILGILSALAGLALLGWLARQPWFYHGLGVSSQSNPMALLLFMLVTPVFMQFFQPISAYFSRRHEFEADEFAVRQTGAEPMVNALVKLYRENASTLTPDPLYSAFHDSHPPAPVRVNHITNLRR